MAASKDVALRLDEALSRPGSPVGPELAPLVVLANQVRAMSRVQPTSGFVDALDRQLRRQAEAQRRARPRLTPAPLVAGLRQWAMRGAAVAAVTAALMFAGWGTVQAAQESLPGHPLYGVKRAAEAIELALQRDPAGQAALHLRFLVERFEEAAALAEAGQAVPPGLIDDASSEFDAVVGLLDDLPPESRDDVAGHLMEVFAQQEQRLMDKLADPTRQNTQGLERALEAVHDRMRRFENGMPGQGRPDDVSAGPEQDTPVSGPFQLDAEADIAQIKEARAAQREAQRNERRASQIAGKYAASDAEVWAIYYDECDQDWKCVRTYYRDLERENRAKGRPESAGSQGQGKPEDTGPPFDDGPPADPPGPPGGPPDPPGGPPPPFDDGPPGPPEDHPGKGKGPPDEPPPFDGGSPGPP